MGAITHNRNFFPMMAFGDLALELPKHLLSALLNAFALPTPIQMLAIPAALAGRDITGIAETGSGKVVAHGIPLLSHDACQQGASIVELVESLSFMPNDRAGHADNGCATPI